MIKTIIFDFDGTIADTLMTVSNILGSLSTKYGYKRFSDKEINEMRDYTIQEIFKKANVPIYKLPFLVGDVKKELNKNIINLKPIKGMPDVLSKLKKENYKLAIITSNDKVNVQTFLKRNSLDFFDFIYTGTTIFGKGRVIQGFLNKYNIGSDKVIYVGDEIRDIEATKGIGIPIIAGTWGFNSRKGLEKFWPKYLIDNPKDIITILQNI